MAPCSKCEKNKPIVNRTKWLCGDCNYERLHNGASRAQVYSERIKQRVEQKIPKLNKLSFKQKYINQQTAKEKDTKEKLSALKLEIEIEAQHDNHYYCWGCGKGEKGLDKSHILSVKQRKDLELDKPNINLLCRGCHVKWEGGNIKEMIMLDCFEKDIQYIRDKDIGRYNKLVLMIQECAAELFDKFIDDKDSVPTELYQKVMRFEQNYNCIV